MKKVILEMRRAH